jgi:transposase-like protein
LFESRGINWGTFQNQRSAILRNRQRTASTAQEATMPDESTEVLPGQLTIDDTDTAPAEVYYDAVGEFDALPEGYAKEIQPMRAYTDAEDEALKESVRLFGFIGTIVRDQYGRILDGNQRARVARWFGKGCPYTITHVKDDAHAMEIATQLNLARRHYTQEQRQQIALSLRDKGASYRYIAEALGVSPAQALTDVRRGEQSQAVQDLTPSPTDSESPVQDLTPNTENNDSAVQNLTPQQKSTDSPASSKPERRTTGRDQKSYPGRRPQPPADPEAESLDWLGEVNKALGRFVDLLKESRSMGGLTLMSNRWPVDKRRSLSAELRHQGEVMTEMADWIDKLEAENGYHEA